MTEEKQPGDPHDQPYRPEDFTDIRYKPLTRQEHNNRRLLISAIVTVLVIALALCVERPGVG